MLLFVVLNWLSHHHHLISSFLLLAVNLLQKVSLYEQFYQWTGWLPLLTAQSPSEQKNASDGLCSKTSFPSWQHQRGAELSGAGGFVLI